MIKSLQNLSALGCNFAVGPNQIAPDPEQTVIDALDFFWKDKKVFTMLLGLVKFRIHHLINTQRLLILAKNLHTDKKIILIVFCIKLYRATKDTRYLILAKRLKRPDMRLSQWPKQYADPFYIQRRGFDRDFKKFKILVADFFDTQHEGKFKSLELIYAENPWLRLRALIGTDYRADAFYLRAAKIASNQAEAARIIGCDKSSISRIWNSIKGFDALVSYV